MRANWFGLERAVFSLEAIDRSRLAQDAYVILRMASARRLCKLERSWRDCNSALPQTISQAALLEADATLELDLTWTF